MKSANPETLESDLEEILLDDEHAHILIEYDQEVISLPLLIETIKMNGAQILETIPLREEMKRRKSILFKLNVQDVREIILHLSIHPLFKVKGYNSK